MHAGIRAAGIVAGLTLSLGTLAAPATAGHHDSTEPCAKQEQKVEKATAALDRVTAVFERQKDKVADAADDVAEADSRSERRAAKADLAEAKAARAESKGVKKAQLQRLAKAQERLDACLAEEPTEPAETVAG
jgi:hypothetical protein